MAFEDYEQLSVLRFTANLKRLPSSFAVVRPPLAMKPTPRFARFVWACPAPCR